MRPGAIDEHTQDAFDLRPLNWLGVVRNKRCIHRAMCEACAKPTSAATELIGSPLHAHSGDFHGVLIKGTWLHEDASGNGTPVQPGSYVRQAGGEMHVDRCVSKEPCLLFLFQYARADVILPK